MAPSSSGAVLGKSLNVSELQAKGGYVITALRKMMCTASAGVLPGRLPLRASLLSDCYC